MVEKVGGLLELAAKGIDRLNETKESIDMILKRFKDKDEQADNSLMKKSKAVKDSIQTLIELINQKEVQGIRRDRELAGSRLSSVYRSLQSSWDAPTEAEKTNLKFAEESLAAALEKINRFYEGIFPDYKKAVDEAGLGLFEKYEPLSLK